MSIKSFPGGEKLDWEGLENVPSFVKTVNNVSPDKNGNVEITIPDSGENANGGMSTEAAALLITILRNGTYSTDQSANITALESSLGNSSDDGSGDNGATGSDVSQSGPVLTISGVDAITSITQSDSVLTLL